MYVQDLSQTYLCQILQAITKQNWYFSTVAEILLKDVSIQTIPKQFFFIDIINMTMKGDTIGNVC